VISGGFITQANADLGKYKSNSSNVNTAYWLTFWAAFVTWTLIGIFIILVILACFGFIEIFGAVSAVAEANPQIVSSSETATGISWVTMGFLLFSLALVVITGVLSAMAASSLNSGSNPSQQAYSNCIISSCMCLASGGLLLIGTIVYVVIKNNQKKKQQELIAKEELLALKLSTEKKNE
jgi:hypothetical protein